MSPIDLTPIFELPVEQRQEIVERINESIVNETGSIGLTEEKMQELAHRLEEFKKNPEKGIPWEEAKQRILSRKRP